MDLIATRFRRVCPYQPVAREQRQRHRKNRASSFAFAVSKDRAAVNLDHMPHDCETQPKSPMLPRRAAVGLPKTLKDMRQKVCADALAIVGDLKVHMRGVLEGANANLPTRGRKLDGVREQIPDDLLQTMSVTGDQRGMIAQFGFNPNPFRIGSRTHDINRGFDYASQLSRLEI